MKRVGEKIRKTGIDIIGNAPWGAHFCLFYKTKEDLIDILVPYSQAGLENNEFCIWVTSEPLREKEAKEAMREAVPNFTKYLKRGQIEIVPHTKWYLKDGVFNLQRVLNAWNDKLNQAQAKGYDGIRVTGDTTWLKKRDWRNFADYEKKVNNTIGKYQMIAICTYPLDKCRAAEVIDVVYHHQFALIKRGGNWEMIESSQYKQAKEVLEQKVKEATGRLKKQHKAQENFFIDLAHELKTPLTVMKGEIGLFLTRFLVSQKEEVERIEKIINDLSTLAKAETNQLILQFRKLRLDQLIEKVCLRLQTIAKQEKKKLLVKKLMPLTVRGDRERLEQLISNLLNNAIKFTKKGLGQIEVSLTEDGGRAKMTSSPAKRGPVSFLDPDVTSGYAKIRIKDNGVGIPKKDLPYVFKRFYRGANTKRRQKFRGSGLGLAICQWIVRQHGGKIRVKSKHGVGTEFLVFLPRLLKRQS